MEIKLKSWTTFNFIDEVKMKQFKKIIPYLAKVSDPEFQGELIEKTWYALSLDEDFEDKFNDLSISDSMDFVEKYYKYFQKVIEWDKKKSVKQSPNTHSEK